MKYFVVLSFLWLFGFWGCGDGKKISGTDGSTETTNGLSVIVMDDHGSILQGAKVYLIEHDNWLEKIVQKQSLILDSGITDVSGEFISKINRKFPVWVVSIKGNTGFRKLVDTTENELKQNSLTLEKIVGEIDSASNGIVYLEGFPNTALVDSTGKFKFEALPRGVYNSTISYTSSQQQYQYLGELNTDEENVIQLERLKNGMLIEDFEDADLLPVISDFSHIGFWWLAWKNGEDTLGIRAIPNSPIQGIKNENNNNFMGFELLIPNVNQSSWLNFGINLGMKGLRQSIDLSPMKAIHFSARGSGEWRVILNILEQSESSLSATFHPDSTWNDFIIPVDEFGATDELLKKISALMFQTDLAGKLEIDNVFIEGIDLRSWTLEGY